jgi:hypothetical protein
VPVKVLDSVQQSPLRARVPETQETATDRNSIVDSQGVRLAGYCVHVEVVVVVLCACSCRMSLVWFVLGVLAGFGLAW